MFEIRKAHENRLFRVRLPLVLRCNRSFDSVSNNLFRMLSNFRIAIGMPLQFPIGFVSEQTLNGHMFRFYFYRMLTTHRLIIIYFQFKFFSCRVLLKMLQI